MGNSRSSPFDVVPAALPFGTVIPFPSPLAVACCTFQTPMPFRLSTSISSTILLSKKLRNSCASWCIDPRKSSFSSLSLSMNARGATVPRSAGFLLMCRNSERSADSSVGGCGGMVFVACPFGGEALWEPGWGAAASETEYLRSSRRREYGAGGCGCAAGGRGAGGGGEGDVGSSGAEGSGYCTRRSRKGPQK